jgi:hypothetical protein
MSPIGYSGVRGKLTREKNRKSKISCQTPFKFAIEYRFGHFLKLVNTSNNCRHIKPDGE